MKATGALGVGTGIALTTGTAATADPSTNPGTNSWDNALSATILNPGGTAPWWFSWGDDRHVQIAGPNILPPQNGAKHTYYNFGKSMSGNAATYYVTVRNDGGVQTVHNLEGGGLT